MRITVHDVLGWLSHGMTEEGILGEHPGLEKDHIAAVMNWESVFQGTPDDTGQCGQLRQALGR